MATEEMNTEGDRRMNMLPTSAEDSCPVLRDGSAPLNFPTLTLSQFGISVQSFTPASSNQKEKSVLAQIKSRRRSTVGVHGSPETNSLIRFMAQQKMKTTSHRQTSEVASTLRQKVASFQSLMDVEDRDVCDLKPRQGNTTNGCIKIRECLSDRETLDGVKENHPPMMTHTPSKRRCVGLFKDNKMEIREANTAVLNDSFKEHEDDVFEFQSPDQPPSGLTSASPAVSHSSFHKPCIPSLLEPTGEDFSSSAKKKRVQFGSPLSPEIFDQNLPPSTPIKKGGMPAQAPTPGGNLKLRSLLKTPQKSESHIQHTQQDLSIPAAVGISPTLSMPRNCRMYSMGEDSVENDGKIIFPLLEEIDSVVTRNTECIWDAQLSLNNAVHDESLSGILTESVTKPRTPTQMDSLDEPVCLSENHRQPQANVEAPALARCSKKRKKSRSESESTTEAPTCSSSRKRKACSTGLHGVHCSDPRSLPAEREHVRSTRSAAKSASGKMKMTFTTSRRWNKEVNRSLYGSREYASKNPTLSPITEKLSIISQFPAAQHIPTTSSTTQSKMPHLTEELREFVTYQEVSTEIHFKQTAPEQEEVDTDDADASCMESNEKSECHPSQEGPTSACPPLGEEFSTESAERRAKEVHQCQKSHDLEKEHGDQTACQQKNIRPSSDSPEEGGEAFLDLAPWQVDFNFFDVFRPVTATGHRPVRRSLRNQSNAENGSNGTGLVWLPRTSPESSKGTCRRSLSRRRSAALPVQPSLPEETQHTTL